MKTHNADIFFTKKKENCTFAGKHDASDNLEIFCIMKDLEGRMK